MSLVRPNLKLGSLIWFCNYSKYVNSLDNVQYKFLKRIAYVFNKHITRDTVNVVKNYLDLDFLSVRLKLLTNVMLVYNIWNNLIDCLDLLSRIGFRIPSRNS